MLFGFLHNIPVQNTVVFLLQRNQLKNVLIYVVAKTSDVTYIILLYILKILYPNRLLITHGIEKKHVD